jgi:hypothetical protein
MAQGKAELGRVAETGFAPILDVKHVLVVFNGMCVEGPRALFAKRRETTPLAPVSEYAQVGQTPPQ